MSVNNNNNVSIYERFRVSWYTKHSLFSMASDDDVYLHRWGGADLYLVSGNLMASIMASNSNYMHYVCIHFSSLLTFVVNTMYLQIIYQRKALQKPKMMKEKAL